MVLKVYSETSFYFISTYHFLSMEESQDLPPLQRRKPPTARGTEQPCWQDDTIICASGTACNSCRKRET